MTDFSLAAGRQVRGDYAVYPNSLLFVAGEYPDKGFSITPEELAAAADCSPVPFNVEHSSHGAHKATEGLFGGILRQWIDPADPTKLRGEVSIPLPLDEKLATKAPSMEFAKDTKKITGAALTYTPRVSDAALMSEAVNFAMTRHNTPEGQMVMQDIHDLTARGGAVCERPKAKMASSHESTAIQKMHDMAADHGADCAAGDKPSWAKAMYSSFNSPPATTKHPASDVSAKGAKSMSLLDKITAHFTKLGVPASEINFTQDDLASLVPVPPPGGMTEAEKALFSQQAETIKRLTAQSIAKDAASFADAAIAENRALPAERASLVALFAQAAQDDAASPATITFSQNDKGEAVTGSRVDALTFAVASRPAHTLRKELVPGATYFSLHPEKQTTEKDQLDKLDAETRAWGEKQNKTGANHNAATASGRN